MIGFARPDALNHAPSACRNLTGEVDTLLAAFGLSLPRGESPTPQTKFVRAHRLEHVIGGGERAPADLGGLVCSRRVELRVDEERLVALVHHDELVDRREGVGDLADPGGEGLDLGRGAAAVRVARRGALRSSGERHRVERVQVELDRLAVRRRGGGRPRDGGLVGDRGRRGLVPAQGQRAHLQPLGPHRRVEPADHGRILRDVVVHAHDEECAGGARENECGQGRADEEPCARPATVLPSALLAPQRQVSGCDTRQPARGQMT